MLLAECTTTGLGRVGAVQTVNHSSMIDATSCLLVNCMLKTWRQ